jgi:hypothetical protein
MENASEPITVMITCVFRVGIRRTSVLQVGVAEVARLPLGD